MKYLTAPNAKGKFRKVRQTQEEFMAWSKIEWTEASWNPVTGCTKVSEGCRNCYAERMAKRLQAMGNPNYKDGFALRLQRHMLELPLSWKSPRKIFVNSMSDFFHEQIPLSYIQEIFAVMRTADHHIFQVLTKRSARLLACSPEIDWPENVWMGVTVENAEATERVRHLVQTGAAVKFLSCEPLLSPLKKLDLDGIDWVIAGGESGPGSRPMREEWALELRDRCLASATPFFFKQWGGVQKKRAGRLLDGVLWSEFPATASGLCPA
jgi:protein gp37